MVMNPEDSGTNLHFHPLNAVRSRLFVHWNRAVSSINVDTASRALPLPPFSSLPCLTVQSNRRVRTGRWCARLSLM